MLGIKGVIGDRGIRGAKVTFINLLFNVFNLIFTNINIHIQGKTGLTGSPGGIGPFGTEV